MGYTPSVNLGEGAYDRRYDQPHPLEFKIILHIFVCKHALTKECSNIPVVNV